MYCTDCDRDDFSLIFTVVNFKSGDSAAEWRRHHARSPQPANKKDRDGNRGGNNSRVGAAVAPVAVVKTAQRLGVSLAEIREALDALPAGRTPDAADWARMSKAWQASLDARIAALTRLRDNLNGCIGCGCLSIKACPLRNPGDVLSEDGPGPRLLE